MVQNLRLFLGHQLTSIPDGKWAAILQEAQCTVSRDAKASITLAESRKHYGRTVIDRRKICRTLETRRKVLEKNLFLDEN